MKTIILSFFILGLALSPVVTAQENGGLKAKRIIDPIDFSKVTITDNFWKPRIEKHATKMLPVVIDQIEVKTGRMRNFERAAQRKGEFEGIFFDDSDVYKAMEGMAYSLVHYRNPLIEKKLDEWIDKIAAAQWEDGYLNTYYTLKGGMENRWTDMDKHEMYCAGHLIEAAVAYYQVTGKRKLLDVAIRFADHIDNTFGPSKRNWVTGHQEIELALVKLYNVTNQTKYLDLAYFLLEQRGHDHGSGALWPKGGGDKLSLGGPSYCQDDVPVAEQTNIRGHAVRAMYLFCGMADVAALTGNQPYMDALDRLWKNVVFKNMYITGGIGSSRQNEGFAGDYNLPNEEAYCETCASAGMILWNARMNQMSGDGKYYDIVERSLYNGLLAGMNLEATRFFYVNPLASKGDHHRKAWYGTACCPSQMARIIPSVGNYIYGKGDESIYVNLYIGSQTTIMFPNRKVSIAQESNYPWDGTIKIKVSPSKTHRFEVNLRIPAWSNNISIGINGKLYKDIEFRNGYAKITRNWKKGDVIELNLDMSVRMTGANMMVVANWGRRAVQRGPLVYCLEEVDNPRFEENYLYPQTMFYTNIMPGLLGGIYTIQANNPDGTQLLYLPYYAWDNRAAGRMEVWTNFDEESDIY